MELIIIMASFLLAALIGLLTKRRNLIEFISVGASVITLVASVIIALKVASLGTYNLLSFFSVDSLGAIIILIIAFIGLATTVYSIPFLRQEVAKNIIGFRRVKQCFVLLNIFLLAMYLAVVAESPVFAWIAIEATTLSTAFLISFYNKPSAIEGAWKYLILNSLGLLLGFFGTLLYFTSINLNSGDFVSWQSLMANISHFDPMVAKIAFIFVIIGYGTKVGLVPMHTWKPDAYSKAPAPLGALLSGALFPVAIMMILKFKIITDATVGVLFSQQLLIIFGVLSVAVAAMIMYNSKNYKRLLAYSSIENAGVVILGFGFGGFGIYAAMLHLIYHSCVKAILFFSSGNLLLKYNSAKIKNIKNALGVLPITSILFISGFLIVTGTPPFGIFLTKMYILSSGFKNYPIVAIITLFFMAIIFISFLKHVSSMMYGETPADVEVGEGNKWLLIPPAIFLILVVVLSFYIPPFLHTLINDVALHY
jgi:hydrogenase-4 component F